MRGITGSAIVLAIHLSTGVCVLAADSEERAAVLAEQLASPNKAPRIDVKYELLPSDFDRQGQERVFKAVAELVDMREKAFPVLVRHLDDSRYCSSISYAAWVDHSVGEICWRILDCELNIYLSLPRYRGGTREGRITGQGPSLSYTQAHLANREAREQWVRDHRGKALWEIQVEVLQWVVSQEKQGRFESAHDEAQTIGSLQFMIDQIRTTKNPSLYGGRFTLPRLPE